MKHRFKNSIWICSIVALSCLAASAQRRAAGETAPVASPFSSISRREIELLMADVAKNNPKVLERLAADPELKRQQVENLRELLAFASQAVKEGLAVEPINKQELENIKAEILAVNYDREINKDKGPIPPFSNVTEAQVASYWADKSGQPTHESQFQSFLDTKISILNAQAPDPKEPSLEEVTQARDIFARIRISRAAYDQGVKAGRIRAPFTEKANLQVKLQQAQFLARAYRDHAARQIAATDEEIALYIASHSELDTRSKKAKAEQILARAVAGENFAALANEFSQDPGNKGPDGQLHGGLYENVPEGTMVRPFEQASLVLEPGQIAPRVVETDFGYHIIKLEKKAPVQDPSGNTKQVYDVRHILISTMVKDPQDPNARETPVKDYVRQVIENLKEARLVNRVVSENNIQVPADFTVPGPAVNAGPKAVNKGAANRRPVRRRHR